RGRSREACGRRRRNPPRERGGVAVAGCRARRQEPRGPRRVAARRGGARPRPPALERGRARLPSARRQPADRGHRHQRQDDDDGAIAAARRTFPAVPHRLELVRALRGVRYVNDSKATNTAAARRGVAAYDAPLRLILGGSLKGEDFGPLARDLPPTVRSVYLIVAAADELALALDAAGRGYSRAGDLAHAVARAAAEAEPGDVVLLSPTCA